MPLIDVEKFYKIMPKKSWILDALPNGVTHYNYTRIEAFSALVIVEYQLFTISFFIKTMPKKIMDL